MQVETDEGGLRRKEGRKELIPMELDTGGTSPVESTEVHDPSAPVGPETENSKWEGETGIINIPLAE